MKTLRHIVTYAFWSLLAVWAVALMTVRLPAVQTRLASIVATAVADKLGTRVSVGHIDLGFFNRIIIDSLNICDQQGQPLLRAGRVTARVELLPLLDGQICISSAQLFGAQVQLSRQRADGPTNFQFVLDSLASKDTTHHTPLHLRIRSLIVRNTTLRWDERYSPHRATGIDPAHLHVSDISAYLALDQLTDTSLALNVKRLAMQERSGLKIQKLSFSAQASPKHACLSDFVLLLPNSRLLIDSLQATFEGRPDALFKDIRMETLAYSLSVGQSVFTPSDLAALLPQAENFRDSLTLSAQLEGTRHSVQLHRLQADGPLALHTSGWAQLPGSGSLPGEWQATLHQLTLPDRLLNTVGALLGTNDLGERTGTISLHGTLAGTPDHLAEARLHLSSDAAKTELHGHLDRNRRFLVETDALNLQLHRLTGADLLGELAGRLSVSGIMHPSAPKWKAEAKISHLDLKGYSYHDITATCDYSPHEAQASLQIDDPHLQASATASVQSADLPRRWLQADAYLQARINHISPYHLHLTDKGSELQMGNISLTATQQDGQRQIDLIAPEGNAHIAGHFSPATLPHTLAAIVDEKLPILSDLLKLKPQRGTDEINVSAQLSDTRWLQTFFDIPLQLHSSLNVMGTVNAGREEISLLALMPDFSFSGTRYREGEVSITTPADSLMLRAGITRYGDNGRPLSLQLNSVAVNNDIVSQLTWSDLQNTNHFGGQLNTATKLTRMADGTALASMDIAPSEVILKDAPWQLRPATITYSDKKLQAQQVAIVHDQQHIIINGTASDADTDTLQVDLRDVDVAYILDLVNFHSVDFSGSASGIATVVAPFGRLQADARLTVGNFCFEEGRMGTLFASVLWNSDQEQIDINATADDYPDAMTFINGYVSPRRNYIDLDIRAHNSRVEFMQSFTKSFLSDVTGHAVGHVQLAGPLSNINLTGQLIVRGQAHVDALGTTFTLSGDTVRFVPDDILLNRIRLHDAQGNTAFMSGGIHHQHLTRLTFDLDIDAPRPLLAYSFPGNDRRETFYGTVMAQGKVDMHGRPGEVTINVDATPTQGTAFTYNAAQADGIANQDFIQWNTAPAPRVQLTAPLGQQPVVAALPMQQPTMNSRSDLRMNFRINATPEAELHLLMDANTGDEIVLRGNGVMHASFYNKGAFQLFGTYRVESGTYGITIQNIIKKNFTFQPGGTIIFGGAPMQASLNLHALHTVYGVSLSDLNIGSSFASNTVRVNCLMNISGIASAPQVDFNLELPTVNADEQQMVRSLLSSQQQVNQQVVYLLGIGRFYNDQANTNQATNGEQADQTTLAMQSLLSGTLSSQVNTLLGRLIKTNDWNFGTNISTGTEGWYNAEYEGLVSGRMLNNRLLINGQFGYRDNAQTASSSFIGDFDISYLLTPNGNIALKVYNQTNDRYFTRSSLNTQGLGIMLKKDFSDLPDLFGLR